MSRSFRRGDPAYINIIPLIDVLVVILFFFLITMDFKQINVLEITPPEIETAQEKDDSRALLVSVSLRGLLAVNGKEVEKSGLKRELERLARQHVYEELTILADRRTALEEVTFVMDVSRKLGIAKIKLRSR